MVLLLQLGVRGPLTADSQLGKVKRLLVCGSLYRLVLVTVEHSTALLQVQLVKIGAFPLGRHEISSRHLVTLAVSVFGLELPFEIDAIRLTLSIGL